MSKKLPTSVRRKIAEWYMNREQAAAAQAAEDAQFKRAKSRLRLYECEECSKKLRVADDHLAALHMHVDPETFEESFHPFIRRTPLLQSTAVPF